MLVDFCVLRYFLRKLKKVKKSNGQMLAINEVYLSHNHVDVFCSRIVFMALKVILWLVWKKTIHVLIGDVGVCL